MTGREPRWWYDDNRRVARTLLLPIAAIYGAIARRRLNSPPTYCARIPVICAGNFTAGGTGKTPFTAYLVQHLSERGARPAILTRGHGGRISTPHWVDAATDTARDVGDEPLQHVAMAPTLVSRDRVEGARTIERDPRAFTHIVMDDGLQNPALAKSLSFALIDGRRQFGNGAVIPAGPLRAPLDAQLRLADDIVVNHGFVTGKTLPERTRRHALATFERPILHAMIAPVGDVSSLNRGPIVAFAGIGAPANFFSMLRTLGATIAAEIAFPDHHAYSDEEARSLLARATVGGAMLVTTEKDIARLSGSAGARAQLRAAARAVPIRMHFADDEAARLAASLDKLEPGGRRPTR